MELFFDKEKNFQERIKFVISYANWVRSVDNKVWSGQQAKFINSLMANMKNCLLSKKEYFDMIEKTLQFRGRRRNVKRMLHP